MFAARAPLAGLAALAVLTACSGDDDAGAGSPAATQAPAAARTTTIPLGPAPEAVGQLCGITALRVQQTLCPARFPLRRGSQAADGIPLGPERTDRYRLRWRVTGFRGGVVEVAGQPKPHAIERRRSVLRRTKVGTAPAVVVGGRSTVSVLWNSAARGYLVSLHFEGHPLRDRIAAAVGVARSSVLVPPGGNCDPSTDCG